MDFVAGDVEGGEPADHEGTGGDGEEAFGHEGLDEVDGGQAVGGGEGGAGEEGGFVEFEADEEAEAADGVDEGVVPGGDGGWDFLAEGGGVLAELGGLDFAEDGEGDGAGEGGAAVGGAVGAGAEEVAEVGGVGVGGDGALADPGGADGEAAAEAFGPADGVGGDFGGLGFPAAPMAEAAEAGLDFVEEEEDIVFLTKLGQAAEEVGGGEVDAAFALEGFEEDGGGVGVFR